MFSQLRALQPFTTTQITQPKVICQMHFAASAKPKLKGTYQTHICFRFADSCWADLMEESEPQQLI